MPIVVREEPEWVELMAPETARIGTTLQGWYRVLITPVRTIAWLLMNIGELVLKITMYWYTFTLIMVTLIMVWIIFVTR